MREYTRLAPPERARIEGKHGRMRAIVEAELSAGVAGGTFSTEDPTVTARAILALTDSFAKSLSAEGRTKDEVIVIVQQTARALANCPSASARRSRVSGR